MGIVASGGGAIGYIALGGGALGYYAMGGAAFGKFVLCAWQQDPEAVRLFQAWQPYLEIIFPQMGDVMKRIVR